MAAYGAALSLIKTLVQIQNTPNYPYPQIELLFQDVETLAQFLVDNREVKSDFETQIRDAIYQAQDIIDTHISSTHFLSPSEVEISNQSFCQDLERVAEKIRSISEMTREEFNHQTLDREISNSVWKDSDEIDCLKKYPILGRDEDLIQLKDRMTSGSERLEVVPIVGIAGIGKTALAHCLLEDKLVRDHFDAIGWVKVSSKYNKRDKLLDILGSMKNLRYGIRENVNDKYVRHVYNWGDAILQKTDEQLAKHLYNILKYKRYLILLDDIRDVGAWDDLKELFPDYGNGSRILLTTRNVDVPPARPHLLERLSDEDTFALLGAIVFDGEPCPPYLVGIGEDIAYSCRGFPHAVVIVGKLLMCAKPTAEYWEIILSSINTRENYIDPIEVLVSVTYNHLPQQLKVCLLYMAIFPYNDAIGWIRLMNLWVAEGFTKGITTLENMDFSFNCLDELARRGFLVIHIEEGLDLGCLSSEIAEEVFCDFLVRKAKEEKFFLVIKSSYAFVDEETAYNQQRRLSIQQNIHHFIKKLTEYNSNLPARCLIYSGPKYQCRLCAWSKGLKLLKVLDVPNVGFYTFPPEILKSVQLRYLAFSYNGKLPATVCNLQNIQFLIVSHSFHLKCSGVPSYLPANIWNLKDLMHLHVVGTDLPKPPSDTKILLENLCQLLAVSAHSCTQDIFERIPNLVILEVRIESSPADESLSFFSHLDILNELKVFKCFVMYPDMSKVIPSSIPAFPSGLTVLCLSGCGFPWVYMKVITTLPELRVLNLQTYAFQGPEWEVKEDEFPMLENLLLEDMDLENWTFAFNTRPCFPKLQSLIIRHCYKLRAIPLGFADSTNLDILQVIDCNTFAMNSALEIKEEILNRGNHAVQFDIYSSGDD